MVIRTAKHAERFSIAGYVAPDVSSCLSYPPASCACLGLKVRCETEFPHRLLGANFVRLDVLAVRVTPLVEAPEDVAQHVEGQLSIRIDEEDLVPRVAATGHVVDSLGNSTRNGRAMPPV